MENQKITVLYIDDENINLRLFKSTFRREFIIHTAISAKEGLNILKTKKIDVIITDQRMPDMTGVELLKVIQEQFPYIPPSRLILSGFGETETIENAYKNYNLHKFITKPWDKNNVRQLIYESINAINHDKKEL